MRGLLVGGLNDLTISVTRNAGIPSDDVSGIWKNVDENRASAGAMNDFMPESPSDFRPRDSVATGPQRL